MNIDTSAVASNTRATAVSCDSGTIRRQTMLPVRLSLIATMLVAAIVPAESFGQRFQGTRRDPDSSTRKKNASIPKTEVSFELLTPPQSTGLYAQKWGPVFQKLGVAVRFRRPLLDDKPEVKERKLGRVRLIKVVGKLERDGSIAFPANRFRLSDARKLGAWIRELKTYGAQGTTEGKPGFGLSPSQFGRVFGMLEGPVTRDLAGRKLDQTLAGIGIPSTIPLRLSTEAEDVIRTLRNSPTAPEGLSGLSRGTVLAIVLNQVGLCFRPARTPAGTLQLHVVPYDDDSASWPIGWPLDAPPNQVMPKFVELFPVQLDEVPLSDLLIGAAAKTELPILIDTRRLAAKKIRLEEIKVTQPSKKMTWSGLLDRATFPDVMRELLQDEGGRPFIWITTRSVKQLSQRWKQREALLKANDE